MDMPIDAQVQCLDGQGGQSTGVIINPATRCITHVIVEDNGVPPAQHLVPVEEITLSTPHEIQLRRGKNDLQKMDNFVRIEYEEREAPHVFYPLSDSMLWPAVVMEEQVVPVVHQRLPPGELAVHRGARVTATNGHLGQVYEFLVDPTDEHITALVVRERHLWTHQLLTVPTLQIARIKDDTVYLKSDKQTIKRMQSEAAHSGKSIGGRMS